MWHTHTLTHKYPVTNACRRSSEQITDAQRNMTVRLPLGIHYPWISENMCDVLHHIKYSGILLGKQICNLMALFLYTGIFEKINVSCNTLWYTQGQHHEVAIGIVSAFPHHNTLILPVSVPEQNFVSGKFAVVHLIPHNWNPNRSQNNEFSLLHRM